MKDLLLVFAMHEEHQNIFDDYSVLHTGIGKVNATYALMNYLQNDTPSMIINMGTAGSRKHSGGTIVNPTTFVQRDMDVSVLGFEVYKTPFSSDPVQLEYGLRIDDFPGGVCGTGDNFDASESSVQFDVVDMEAYALALVCARKKIPFLCLKYISDGADNNANADWNAALHSAADVLKGVLNTVMPEI